MAVRQVIAEIGSCDGDLGLAIDTAQAAIEAGAWMVKGQMYRADRLVTKTAPTYGHPSIVEKGTQYEAFERALSYSEWEQVASAVPDGRFFASVFDTEACRDYPYPVIKIASADITYRDLVEAAAATDAYMIVSTGAANRPDIRRMLSWLPGTRPLLMACTLAYPTDPVDANVRKLLGLQQFHLPVGYSDHTRGVQAANLAFDLGGRMVEKHFTIRPGTGGDNDFAITPTELAALVTNREPVSEAVARVYGGSMMLGARAAELRAKNYARRSLRAKGRISAGRVVRPELVQVIRPGGGMAPWLLHEPQGPLGRAVIRDMEDGEAFTEQLLYTR